EESKKRYGSALVIVGSRRMFGCFDERVTEALAAVRFGRVRRGGVVRVGMVGWSARAADGEVAGRRLAARLIGAGRAIGPGHRLLLLRRRLVSGLFGQVTESPFGASARVH